MTIAHLIEGRGESVLSCTVATLVSEAVAILADKRIGALPVIDGDAVVGIFSERDVIYRLREMGPDALGKAVGDVMTAPAVTVSPDTEALTALSLMTRRRIRHLPVVDGTRMVGFVSIGDLVKHRIDKIESEAAAMRDYIQMA